MKNIGITSWNYNSGLPIISKYMEYVKNAGYNPIEITVNSFKIVQKCDGLVLPGGLDVTPELFGFENKYSYCNKALDKFEIPVFLYFFNKKLPILGICRGAQLIFSIIFNSLRKSPSSITSNLEFSQHLNEHYKRMLLRQTLNKVKYLSPKVRKYSVHKIYSFNGNKSMKVNSFHHQGIVMKKKLFDKIINNKLSACRDYEIIFDWYTKEGMPKDEVLIEGFHLRNHPIVGVQWHPEEMGQIELLKEIFQ